MARATNKLTKSNSHCFVVAEVSANHGQNFNRAVALIKKANQCGADVVKFQAYTPDTLTINADNKYFQIKHPEWGGQTYYWKINEVNTAETPTMLEGSLWNFATHEFLVADDWFDQTTTSYYGGDAAQSGDISHSQDSWMQTTVDGRGTVRFYWKVSSELSYDYLDFYIDGSLQDRISGSVDWQQKTYTISTSGLHTLEWQYAKDETDESGSDCGWVDKVEWITP